MQNKKSSRKGQSVIEFVTLVAFVMMFLILFLSVLNTNIVSAKEDRDEAKARQIANIISSEMEFAELSIPGYVRTFSLPLTIDGQQYSLRGAYGREIVISFREKEYVFFLSIDLGNAQLLAPGDNTIRKICPPLLSCTIELVNQADA